MAPLGEILFQVGIFACCHVEASCRSLLLFAPVSPSTPTFPTSIDVLLTLLPHLLPLDSCARQHLTACNNLLALVVPHTSREPCANENDGKDFFFVDVSHMGQMLQAGAFAVSWSSNGHPYAIQRSLIDDILKTNRVPLLKLTAATLLDLKTILASATVSSVCLSPPPLAELTERLERAGTRSQGEVLQVLEDAEADAALLQLELVCDVVLPNARLEDCLLRLKSLR